MTDAPSPPSSPGSPKPPKRYRLPGIEREGVAQLSLLETALWPLKGGPLPGNVHRTEYAFSTPKGRTTANVTVRASMGLQPIDEYVLWGLLGATLSRQNPAPILLATPYWMLKQLGLKTGGFQYGELRDSLLRLALASYQNTGFYDPSEEEHVHVAFQFLSVTFPTVGGAGRDIDNDRCWILDWNAPFFRYCQMTGGNLLFDLDLYRKLSPAARRLFLKVKDRFWRNKRVFLNVDDLTINGLGFSASRPLFKRKFDLASCIRELLDLQILALGRGQTEVKDLFIKRAKGSYVVVLYEGSYFHQPPSQRAVLRERSVTEDPLYGPLRTIGVDAPGIRRLLTKHSRTTLQRWIRITDAAMNEKPRGFPGFKVSPAAFLIDAVEHNRTPPDWIYAHEKRQEQHQWERAHALATQDEVALRHTYEQERSAAFHAYVLSDEGQRQYEHSLGPLLELHKLTDPHRFYEAAREAALARIEQLHFKFPEYATWILGRQATGAKIA